MTSVFGTAALIITHCFSWAPVGAASRIQSNLANGSALLCPVLTATMRFGRNMADSFWRRLSAGSSRWLGGFRAVPAL